MPDLIVSVIPHFNQEIAEEWKMVKTGKKPFVTFLPASRIPAAFLI